MRSNRVASFACVVGLAGALSSAAPAVEQRAAARTGTVVAVAAGDALDVRFAGGRRERIRLTGVVAPRAGSCGAAAAAAEARRRSMGKRVTLVADPAGRSGSSYVLLPGGTDLGRTLVRAGLAQIDAVDQRFGRFAAYVPVQRAAEEARRGAWESCGADVAVRLDAPTEPIVTGDSVRYTATVTNAGPLAARDVALELRAPPGMSLIAAESPAGACDGAGWMTSCTFATLRAGGYAVVTITLRADQAGVAPVRAWASFIGCTAACRALPLHDTNLANDRTAALTTILAEAPPPGGPPPASCHPSYPTICIPPPPPDLNCDDIPHQGFPVLETVPDPDPHELDGDDDGVACFKGDY